MHDADWKKANALTLSPQDLVTLESDPDNPEDATAIAVYGPGHKWIGYNPKRLKHTQVA